MQNQFFIPPLRDRGTPRRTTNFYAPCGREVRGFSMVEVLVSIVVLSFGLLGMVGMQAASLKSNREARLQSAGVVLAREYAEMIRGNKVTGVATGTANPYLGSFISGTSSWVAAAPAYCLSVGTIACTSPLIVANAQVTEWLDRVQAELPGARVDVCYDIAPFDATGLPQWNCTAGAGAIIVVKIGWTRGSTDKSITDARAFVRATTPSIVLPVTAGSSV